MVNINNDDDMVMLDHVVSKLSQGRLSQLLDCTQFNHNRDSTMTAHSPAVI